MSVFTVLLLPVSAHRPRDRQITSRCIREMMMIVVARGANANAHLSAVGKERVGRY
jgi:hypothetical protein